MNITENYKTIDKIKLRIINLMQAVNADEFTSFTTKGAIQTAVEKPNSYKIELD